MSDDLREREDIQAAIAGQTTCDLLRRNAEVFGARSALSWRDHDGRTRTLTWGAYRSEVGAVALGLADLGVGQGDVVALMGTTRPEHHLADQGVVHAGAVPTTLYRTLAPEQIAYAADDCRARVAVLENGEYMERWSRVREHLDALETIVLIEDAAAYSDRDGVISWQDLLARGRQVAASEPERFDELASAVDPEDVCVLLYTSGTTGRPKGVELTHANIIFELESLERLLELPQHAGFVSYLPMAHIAERIAGMYGPLKLAGHSLCCPDPRQIREYLTEARPTVFFGVPRVWEKFRSGITSQLAEQPTARRRLAERALRVGRAVTRLRQRGRRPSLLLRAEYRALDALVLSTIREAVGLDQCPYRFSAAAPLADEIAEFFSALGLPILEAYGLTETTGLVTTNVPEKVVIGTVGRPIPGIEVRLADDGELKTRGPVLTPGYLRMSEETEHLFDDDGWLATGDLAEIRDDGYVSIVDRKKELIITSGGQNVSPTSIESELKEHPLVGHAVAYGDDRPYIVALIVLDEDAAPDWAARRGIDQADMAELARHPEVRAEVDRAVETANERLAGPEQVRGHTILPVEWTPDSEELTPTLKLKRRVIHERYAEEIASLYDRGAEQA